jgi:DNA-binding NarL/FixJ family response regulator
MATMLDENCVVLHSSATTTRQAVLLDQHPLLMDTVERVLEHVGVATVGKYTSAREALRAVQLHRPAILVVDLGARDGDLDSLACIRSARTSVPELKPVVLTDRSSQHLLASAFVAGAAAAVFRTAHAGDLAMAVRQVFEPSVYLAHAIHPRDLPVEPSGPGCDLTKREREILQLVAEGYSNSRVARTLWVTEQTVKFHLSNVYRKLDVCNRTEASRWAQLNGLLSAEPAA